VKSQVAETLRERPPKKYQNRHQKLLDAVAWILEEAGKSDSINQMNVMEVILRT